MGTWAAAHIPTLPVARLRAYEDILELETVDLYNVVNGRMPPPPVRARRWEGGGGHRALAPPLICFCPANFLGRGGRRSTSTRSFLEC